MKPVLCPDPDGILKYPELPILTVNIVPVHVKPDSPLILDVPVAVNI
jgi:hypothetical protein